MSGTPKWKVYREGEYVAACKYAEDAAVLVAASGGVVKYDHRTIVWTEGKESFSASVSYDRVAKVMHKRAEIMHKRAFEQTYPHTEE